MPRGSPRPHHLSPRGKRGKSGGLNSGVELPFSSSLIRAGVTRPRECRAGEVGGGQARGPQCGSGHWVGPRGGAWGPWGVMEGLGAGVAGEGGQPGWDGDAGMETQGVPSPSPSGRALLPLPPGPPWCRLSQRSTSSPPGSAGRLPSFPCRRFYFIRLKTCRVSAL